MLLEENVKGTAFIVGRFQPITKLHYKIIDDARKKYQTIFVVVVNPPVPPKEKRYNKKGELRKPEADRIQKNPFNLALRMKLIHEAFGGKIHPSHIISAENGFTPDIVEKIMRYTSKDKLREKIVLLAGSDRIPAYKRQLESVPGLDNVEIQEIPRDMDSADNVSATKVRNALKSGDEDTFKQLTPGGIHDEFNRLRKHVMSEGERSFFRKMLLEMTHIEDLKVSDFIDFVKNIYQAEASIKLDGTVALLFGLSEDGRFYTGLGRDFREVKEEKRVYSIKDWLKTEHIKVNSPVSAHAALESKIDIIRKHLKPGETATAEIMFGDKPNSIKYDFSGVNWAVILNNNELGKSLKGKVTITVPNYVLDSENLEKKNVRQQWDFGITEHADPKKYNINIKNELEELEKFLNSETDGVRNIEILSMRAAGKNKDLVKEVRDNAQNLKLNIKEKLLQQYVRQIQGGIYAPAKGHSHEGIVLKKGDKMTKIIDKEVFTKIHEQDWEPVNAAIKISKALERAEISKEDAIKKIDNMIKNFDKDYPKIDDKETKRRMINNLKMTKLELKGIKDES